ncbi:estradiol 17-beta-dehydrogenase 2, partial [Nephila pilipes]
VIALPFATPYTVSKYAAAGLTECLKEELDMRGIKVVSIEPELFKTRLTSSENIENEMDASLKKYEEFVKDIYGEDPRKYITKIKNFFLFFASSNISAVVDDLESAVSLLYPDDTYKCRRHGFARFIVFCLESLPRSWRLTFIKVGVRILFPKPKKNSK